MICKIIQQLYYTENFCKFEQLNNLSSFRISFHLISILTRPLSTKFKNSEWLSLDKCNHSRYTYNVSVSLLHLSYLIYELIFITRQLLIATWRVFFIDVSPPLFAPYLVFIRGHVCPMKCTSKKKRKRKRRKKN